MDLPLILPPAVAGVALLLIFGRRGLLGPALDALDIQIVFTPAAVVLAQIFVAAPFYIKSASAGFAEVDRESRKRQRLTARAVFDVFRYVTAALAWPAPWPVR